MEMDKEDTQLPDSENLDSENLEDESTKTPSRKRKGRGATQCLRLSKMPEGEVRNVVFNANGQPIGDDSILLASWTGMLARSKVRIIYENWKAVPDGVKDSMWTCLQSKFNLGEDERGKRLSAVGAAWKKFKSTLTTCYILPNRDEPEKLKAPPLVYKKYITQRDWEVFVKTRLSDEFQVINKKQSSRRKKKLFNHRISKKGYARLAEELKEKLGPTFDGDRSFLWEVAHQDGPDSYPDDATREVANKIAELRVQAKEGKIITQGSKDILSMALGTPEHGGQVRAAGAGVTPTVYFHLTRRGSKKHVSELESSLRQEQEKRKEEEDKRREELEKRLNLEQRFKELENKLKLLESGLTTPPTSEKVASNSNKSDNRNHITSKVEHRECETSSKRHQKAMGNKQMQKSKPVTKVPKGPTPNMQVLKPMSGLGEGKSCCLALGVKSNIVAKGKVFEECGPEYKLHTVALGVNNFRVSIDEVICDDALLPIPFGDEFVTVRHAHNSYVAWPKEFVLKDKEVSSQKIVEGFKCKEKDINQSKTSESSSNLQGSIDSFKEALHFMLPSEDDHVRFPLGKDFLGGNNGDEFSYLPKSDIIDACNVETLEAINIIAYMRCLYEKFETTRDAILFVNPVTFSRAEDKDKSKVLLKRLQETKGKRFAFIPFNPGNHWILIAIDLVCMDVFWLDSLHGEPDRDLKIIVNTALMLFKRVEENKVISPTWHSSKVPRQPNFKECGFYCMKFMRELIKESSQSMEIRVKNLVAQKKYTKNDIDELRVEFIEFVQYCMGAYSQD